MSKAHDHYNSSKHEDTWGVAVVYPTTVEEIIQIARLEGAIETLRLFESVTTCFYKLQALQKELDELLKSLEN